MAKHKMNKEATLEGRMKQSRRSLQAPQVEPMSSSGFVELDRPEEVGEEMFPAGTGAGAGGTERARVTEEDISSWRPPQGDVAASILEVGESIRIKVGFFKDDLVVARRGQFHLSV